ncbi:hypothetical protein GWI33_004013 [Rhynchophorus ferrugineus]|uniref:Uncharacterized protein n=1 Tax=Rhynchophorus ferrugineus TaxID=354439 RepID=A0A834HK81_RHYFE|nr:hypothetical protein GWI33_004013 [Rhynchophorus ferrugineus]
MLNSLDALAGKLSPGAGSNIQSSPQQSMLDTNANRVHPYLKQASTASSSSYLLFFLNCSLPQNFVPRRQKLQNRENIEGVD